MDPAWKPDFGPAEFNDRVKGSGATAISARDFLIAYNINLNTTSVRRANSLAFDLRENGRVLREGDPITGKVVTDENGEPRRQPGALKAVKGIGWFIEEYGIAQVSLNLTNIRQTPMHIAFDTACEKAHEGGMRVTGSELVGLVPLEAMLDAGRFFLKKQQRSVGVPESELIKIAIVVHLGRLKPPKGCQLLNPKTSVEPFQSVYRVLVKQAKHGLNSILGHSAFNQCCLKCQVN
jgi:glutamate formiminotransferase/formiminotetrahydrofolate cyclodeaminase